MMASSPGVPSSGETPSLPKFMPPVTLTSLAPHPSLPLQPAKSQFIIPPPALDRQETVQAPTPGSSADATSSSPPPKNILAAAKAGNLEWVKRYSAAGQTEMADNMGETALLKACELGYLHVVEYLFQIAKADVSHADTDGWTALHNASSRGHLEIVRLLLTSAKTNINAQSGSTGYTPLMTAASRSHRAVLDLLIASPDIDLFVKNLQQESVYDIAAEKGDLVTCELIERCERDHWTKRHPNQQYDSTTLHTVIPCTVVENARVNPRTRLPDPRALTTNVDPPHFTPSRKQDISLPHSKDPSAKWIWITKWTVSCDQSLADPEGWRYAQRWDVPIHEWVSNPANVSPISRSGLASRRIWVRVMKYCPAQQEYVGDIDSSENETPDNALPRPSERTETSNLARPRAQPRANSMGARLVGLVAGTSKDLEESEGTDITPDVADESENDEIFSTRALSLTTTTPASSLHEGIEESQYALSSDVEEGAFDSHQIQTAHGHRPTQSASSSQYPRRIAIGDGAIPQSSSSARQQRLNNRGSGGGNEGNRNPGPNNSLWEPDESVIACRLCNRRFTAFIRRHHCRFCGKVVCYRCSASRHPIPQERIVPNPFASGSDDGLEYPRLHRVCDTCVPIVLSLATGEAEISPSSPSVGSLSIPSSGPAPTQTPETFDSRGSELDDRFLIECPVCRTDLRLFGDEDIQAIHVATCLEGHTASPSFSGGSRHLVYRLQEGSPLIGTECVICFEEFEVDDKISRTECLCNFHRRCFRDWMRVGNGCPVHFVRS